MLLNSILLVLCEFHEDRTVNKRVTLNLVFFVLPLFLGFSAQNGLQIWNLEAKIHRLKKDPFLYVAKIQYYRHFYQC